MPDEIVAIVAIVFVIGIPLSLPIVYLSLDYRKRRRFMELHHAERMAAIERGMELPPMPKELLEGTRHRRRSTSLLPGLVWFFIGVAILIALQSISDEEAMIGLVPAGVGLAYLIYYFVEGRKIEARVLEHELATKQEARS
jgi:dolichol kinase